LRFSALVGKARLFFVPLWEPFELSMSCSSIVKRRQVSSFPSFRRISSSIFRSAGLGGRRSSVSSAT
jgi:hypothetical protein